MEIFHLYGNLLLIAGKLVFGLS